LLMLFAVLLAVVCLFRRPLRRIAGLSTIFLLRILRGALSHVG